MNNETVTKQEFNILREDFDVLCSDVTAISEDVKEIKSAILGNPQYGQKGYRQRLEAVENRTEKLENFRKQIIYWAAGASGGSVALMETISRLL